MQTKLILTAGTKQSTVFEVASSRKGIANRSCRMLTDVSYQVLLESGLQNAACGQALKTREQGCTQ